VPGDQEHWLAKAQECLASAEADFAAGRHNSVANRAYYAGFHAAIAALMEADIRPQGKAWEHRFVFSEFSGKLVTRRKAFSARFTRSLQRLYESRIVGDYRTENVPVRISQAMLIEASTLVQAVQEWQKRS